MHSGCVSHKHIHSVCVCMGGGGGCCHGNLGGCIAPTQPQRSEIDVGMAPVGAEQRLRLCKGNQVKGFCKH